MNLIQIASKLRSFTDGQLANELRSPSGSVPAYLILAELNSRKEKRPGNPPKSTVAQDLASYVPQQVPMMQAGPSAMQAPAGMGSPGGGLGALGQGYKDGGRVGSLDRAVERSETERIARQREADTQAYWAEMVPEMDVLGAKVIHDYKYDPPTISDRNVLARRVIANSMHPSTGRSPLGEEKDILDRLPSLFGGTDVQHARRNGPSIYLNADEMGRPFDDTRETINHEFRHVALSPMSQIYGHERNIGTTGLQHPMIAALALQGAKNERDRRIIEDELRLYKSGLTQAGRVALPEHTKRAASFIDYLQGDKKDEVPHSGGALNRMPYRRVDTAVMQKDVDRYARGGRVNFPWNPMTKIPKSGTHRKGIGALYSFKHGGGVGDEEGKFDFAPGFTAPGLPGALPDTEGPAPAEAYDDQFTRWMRRQFNAPTRYDLQSGRWKAEEMSRRAAQRAWDAEPGEPGLLTAPVEPTPYDDPGPSASDHETPSIRSRPQFRPESALRQPGVPGRTPGRVFGDDMTYEEFSRRYAAKDNPYARVQKRLAEMEAQYRGRKDSNLNMALMQTGLGMMASKSPYPLQALGESGIGALKGYREEAKDLRADEMMNLSANAKMTEAKIAYDRGEHQKAFEFLKEGNAMKRHAMTLAARGAGRDSEANFWRTLAVEDFKEGRAARNRVRQDLMDPSKALIFNQELAKRIGKKQGDITAEDQESEIRRRYPISIENPRLAPGQPGETPGGVAKAAKRPDPAGIRD